MLAKPQDSIIWWEILLLLPAMVWLLLHGHIAPLAVTYPALPATILTPLALIIPETFAVFTLHLALLSIFFLFVRYIISNHPPVHKWSILLVLFLNPLFLQASLSLSSLALITAYVILLASLINIRRLPVAKAMPSLGLAMAGLFFSSPHAVFLLPPVISGLVFFISPRLLHKAPWYIFLLLLLPLCMSIMSTAYWFLIHGSDPWQFFHFGPTHGEAPTLAHTAWNAHYQGTFVTSFAMGLTWGSILCLLALTSLQRSSTYRRKLLAFGILAPSGAMALASYYQPGLSPLALFTCLLLANILADGPASKINMLYSLLGSWAAGALLLWLNNSSAY